MSVFRAKTGKILLAAPGRPLLCAPLRSSTPIVTGGFAGPFPNSIAGLSGWWDAGDPTNLLGAGGAALSDFGPGVTGAIDLSGGGNPLAVFHVATSGRSVPGAFPRVAGLLGGLAASTISPPTTTTYYLPLLDYDNGLQLASSQMGSGSAWTRYLVWTRPNWRQGYGLVGQVALLTIGTTVIVSAESTATATRLLLFPSGNAGAAAVLAATMARRHTHSIIVRNTPGAGVDVWLDGVQVATAVANPMAASVSGQMLLLHSGVANNAYMPASGGAQCWFHEAATWERALSSSEITTLLSCATRWPRGTRRGISITPIGQSNCGNGINDGAWNVMAQGIAWHLGAAAWNIVGKYGNDGSSTCTGGRGLYGGSEAADNGTYLTYVAGADPGTWALGNDGTGVEAYVGSQTNDMGDICALLLPWSETDSIRPYSEGPLYQGAMTRFLSLMRMFFGKTAAQLPVLWINAYAYSGGGTGGVQMVREAAAALAAVPSNNVVVALPMIADCNSRGATWNPQTGVQSGGDSEHMDAPDNVTFGMRGAVVAARAILAASGGDTLTSIPAGLPKVGGPVIASAHLASSTTVVVAVVHDAGTDLLVPLLAASGDGWAVMVGGSVAVPGTIVSAAACARTTATTLTLTLASAITSPGSSCLLFYPYGIQKIGRGDAVTDNYSTLARPAGWDIAHDLGSAWNFNWPLAATTTPVPMT